MRATGIGCFFDDPVHQVFGLKDLAFQSLYHFTVGGCVDDARLTTLPAYGARVKARQRASGGSPARRPCEAAVRARAEDLKRFEANPEEALLAIESS